MENRRERTALTFFFFAGKTARSGFPVVSLFFVITDFQIGVNGWEDLKSGFCVYVHGFLEEESKVIEIYTSTTLRVFSGDGGKREPDAE
jgi:hypothetical protein